MRPSIRNYAAIGICLASALLGVVAIQRRSAGLSSIAFNVACAWYVAGSWLAGDLTRKGWARLNKPVAAIYQDVKFRRNPPVPPMARVMNAGGFFLMLAGVLAWFV